MAMPSSSARRCNSSFHRRTREPFDLRDRAGLRVCQAMAKRGVLTRPIGNVIVLMPPYCTTPEQVQCIVAALRWAVSTL